MHYSTASRLIKLVIPLWVLAFFLLQAAHAFASTNKPAHTVATKQGKLKVVKQKSSSEESRAERERRLQRECRGLNNAGACLGYTNP